MCCRFPYEAVATSRRYSVCWLTLPGSPLEVCGPQCAGKVAAATETPITRSRNRLPAFPNININKPSLPHRLWRGAEQLCCLAAATMEHVQALFGAESCLQLTQLHLLIRSGESSAVQRDANHSTPACTSQRIWCVLATLAPQPIGLPFNKI